MDEPMYADFNAQDEDGAVRIFPPFTTVANKEINMQEPILADFNSRDEDDAVRMFLPCKTIALKNVEVQLVEGASMWLSDGEVEMRGILTFRDGIWVVLPDTNGFKYVDENAPYNIKNQIKK